MKTNKLKIDEYRNLVSLLKQALLFYADKKNYEKKQYDSPVILVDNGSQAQFALDKANELEKMYSDIIDEYLNFSELEELKNFTDEKNEKDNSLEDLITKIKNISND